MARGRPPSGPPHRREWTPDIAYVVGLLVTDGHVSVDGKSIVLVSVDREQLETARIILRLASPPKPHRGGSGRGLRIQFSDVLFHRWLREIGFTPRKTYTVGRILVPDEFFRDFLRGHLDGDGTITTYTDRYNTKVKPEYVYQRLYLRFLSASRAHIEWLQERIKALLGVDGYVTSRKGTLARVPVYGLHFAKKDAIALLRWMYYAPDVPCLARKRAIAEPFLTGDIRDFRHPKGFQLREERAPYLLELDSGDFDQADAVAYA